jgi:hypothetical protein
VHLRLLSSPGATLLVRKQDVNAISLSDENARSAAHECFAHCEIAELTIEWATSRCSRAVVDDAGKLRVPVPGGSFENDPPARAAERSTGRWLPGSSVLGVRDGVDDLGVVDPSQETEVIARSACPSWRWMTSSGTPSRDISTAWACLSW